MLSLELIYNCLLKVSIDRQANVCVCPSLFRLSHYDFKRFGYRAALDSKEGSLKARVAPIRAKELGHSLVQWVFARDRTSGIALVKGQSFIKPA
jgi:hypothetical protein